MGYKILAIDPGSTSTKVALFEDETMLFEHNFIHSTDELACYDYVVDQFEWRQDIIVDKLQQEGVDISTLSAVVGRGGLIKPLEGGVYEINDDLWHDTKRAKLEHACNLGALIARAIADQVGINAYIVNPVVVDEMQPKARISGLPSCPRISIFHALNTKEVGRRHAISMGSTYDKMNFIIAHLGGGVTVGAHCQGHVIDTYCGLGGDGSFAPERAGRLPISTVVEICFSGDYTHREVLKMVNGQGGIVAHLGTNSMKEVMQRVADGDEQAKLIVDAFIYNVSKDIGALATVLHGKVDAILITGGVANNNYITSAITEQCGFIAPVSIYPGEKELEALSNGVLAVLRGETESKIYVS